MTVAGGTFGLDNALLLDIRRDMVRFAALQLKDDQLAEDVVQDTMIAALQGQSGFGGKSSVKTWVFAILRNKIIDAIRVRLRSVNFSALGSEEQSMDETFDSLFEANGHWQSAQRPTPWGDPEETLQQEQFWTVFEVCLTHLPENTARVFMMREILELDTSEVCATLNISVSNCNVILHRARNGLRQCLQTGWFGAGERA